MCCCGYGQPVVKSIIFRVNRRLLTVLERNSFGNFIAISIHIWVLFCQIGRQISHTLSETCVCALTKNGTISHLFQDFMPINKVCVCVCASVFTHFFDKNKNNFRIPFYLFTIAELWRVNSTRSLPSIEK